MAKYDFMSFGEAMVRFTPPGHDRLGQAEELQLGIAAAELNCCVNISNLSRKLLKPQLKTGFVTKLVDAWDGDYIIKHAQMHGVDMSNVVVSPYDKIGRNGRNGKCFIEVGIGPRPSYQTYDRGHSAVAMIQPGDIDWESVWIPAGSTRPALSPPWASIPPPRWPPRCGRPRRTARPPAMI